jgi:hypothetical protein
VVTLVWIDAAMLASADVARETSAVTRVDSDVAALRLAASSVLILLVNDISALLRVTSSVLNLLVKLTSALIREETSPIIRLSISIIFVSIAV